MKKTAFTLIEIIICVVIIGVLTVITLNISAKNNYNQYAKLYYKAYDSLVQAVGNAYLDWMPDENGTGSMDHCMGGEYYWSRKCWSVYTGTADGMYCLNGAIRENYNGTNCVGKPKYIYHDGKHVLLIDNAGKTDESQYYGGILGYPRRYPGFLMGKDHAEGSYTGGRYDGWGTDTAFCKDIAKYFNTLETKNDCMSFLTGFRDGVNLSVGHEFHDLFCATDESGHCISSKQDNKLMPSFVASNGQKYYISGLTTANLPYLCGNTSNTKCKHERRYFRFVAVDLNGDSWPNRQYKKKDSSPDIVLFAITDNGSVVPLGLPEYDTTYAKAKVYYPEYLNRKVVINGVEQYQPNTAQTSETTDLCTAKQMAWGNDSSSTDGLVCSKSVMDNTPITYSDLFYWIALNCGVDGCEGQTSHPNCQVESGTNTNKNEPLYADKLMTNIVRQFIFKNTNENIYSRNNGVIEDTIEKTIVPSILNGKLDTLHGCNQASSTCKVQIEHEDR